jgi:hypothetical protein
MLDRMLARRSVSLLRSKSSDDFRIDIDLLNHSQSHGAINGAITPFLSIIRKVPSVAGVVRRSSAMTVLR